MLLETLTVIPEYDIVYPVTEPEGADQFKVTCKLAGIPVRATGVPGTPGVTEIDVPKEFPAEFVAFTVYT